MKTVKVSAVVYEMLLEVATSKRTNPESHLELLIRNEYIKTR